MKPIEQLRQLLGSGEFHHATYRSKGTVWEGLWFYNRDVNGFRGYCAFGCVRKDDPDFNQAMELVRSTGMSVGSYGAG
jgi:hypothetical protein